MEVSTYINNKRKSHFLTKQDEEIFYNFNSYIEHACLQVSLYDFS